MTLTPEMVDKARVDFEKSVLGWPFYKDGMLRKDGRYPEYYGNPVVQGAWEGFKAARAQSQRAVGVEELKKAVAEMEATRHIPTLDASKAWEEGYAAALDIYTESMRALIERAGGGVCS